MNLPEDNRKPTAEFRMIELTLKLRFGSPKKVSELMKIRFDLIVFINVVKESLPYFAVFRTVEKEMINRFNVTSKNKMGFIVSLKLCLNLFSLRWLKPRRNLVNSFMSYEL